MEHFLYTIVLLRHQLIAKLPVISHITNLHSMKCRQMIGPILSCLSKDERTTCQHLDIAILLVEDCKDLNVKDDMGKSPSNYASMSGHFKIVDLIAKRTSSGPLRGTFGLKLIQSDTFEKKVPLFRLLRGSYVRKS